MNKQEHRDQISGAVHELIDLLMNDLSVKYKLNAAELVIVANYFRYATESAVNKVEREENE